MKRLFIAIITGFMFFGALTSAPVYADVAFDKTRLIDDPIFTDVDSMTAQEIQIFLNAHGSLLANWKDDVDMRRPSDNCIVHHATGKTAAEIIHEAATAWGAQVYDSNGCAVAGAYWSQAAYSNYTLQTISPKALLVTLQKEQSLISANGTYSKDSNAYKNPACCTSNEYKLARAMGYGVPDSPGINEKYLGFYNQINWAAWQLRFNYERSAGNTSWDEVGYMTYGGPMTEGTFKRCASCSAQQFDGYYPIDGQSIYMSTRATASLYYYTPHTYPGYTGNYNFVQFFNNWFGSTIIGSYAYQYHSQTANPEMLQGFGNYVSLRFKNTGGSNWYDSTGLGGAPTGTLPVHLATDNPVNRNSKFAQTWPTDSRASYTFNKVLKSNGSSLADNQHMVQPGEIAEFRIKLTAPDTLAPGTYREYFTLVRDGSSGSRMEGGLIWTTATVHAANYDAAYVTQSAPPTMTNFESRDGFYRLRNTGNVDWFDISGAPVGINPVRLATVFPINRTSKFSRLWDSPNRPSRNFGKVYKSDGVTLSSDQHKVQPGQIVQFDFEYSARALYPSTVENDTVRLIRESASNPFFGPYLWHNVTYSPGNYAASFYNQSSYPTMNKGESKDLQFRFKNVGSAAWFDISGAASANTFPIRVATDNPINRASQFSANWTTNNRPTYNFSAVYESDGSTLAANQHQVNPGQIAEFTINIKVPSNMTSGTYQERFRLIKESQSQTYFESSPIFWTNITIP